MNRARPFRQLTWLASLRLPIYNDVQQGERATMYLVSIDTEACTGCGECAASCPAQIITIVDQKVEAAGSDGEQLVHKAQVAGDGDECLGCESCVVVCEVGGVTVQEF
jgi:ferredoxin